MRRAWEPAPVLLPGEFQGQRSLEGYSPWGCKKSDTTDVTQHAQSLDNKPRPGKVKLKSIFYFFRRAGCDYHQCYISCQVTLENDQIIMGVANVFLHQQLELFHFHIFIPISLPFAFLGIVLDSKIHINGSSQI